jgi:hypothetical protein
MNWKMKCLALHALAHMPGGTAVHGLLQKKVTGRYLDDLTPDFLAAYEYHVRNFLSLPVPAEANALEFGAGRNLLTPLLLSAAGARVVFAYDIEPLASVEHVNHVIRQLRSLRSPGINQEWREVANVNTDLRRLYRIEYRAPGDARTTGLPPKSIHFVCSTSTLEHIARDDIVAIIRESSRIVAPAALLSFIIDYHDHYATADRRITRFNFYRYPRSIWRWFNPSNHYQNRLRHSDYEALFEGGGFAAIENRSIIPEGSEDQLRSIRLSPEFHGYSLQDLAALNGVFLLKTAVA